MKKEILESLLQATGSTAVDFLREMTDQNPYLQTLKDNVQKKLRQVSQVMSTPLALLQKAYEKNDVVVVLGAGVSAPHKLPTWEELLQLLLIEIFDETPFAEQVNAPKDISSNLSKLYAEVFQTSPLISARYLRAHYGTDGSMGFEMAVRNALYAKLVINRDDNLFKELRNLCIAPGQSPNLNCVITYNYDDILETFLRESNVQMKFMPVHSVGMNPAHDELGIYHVHGYLPNGGTIDTSNKITLSEDGYHSQYQDIYSWCNMVQINKFKDNTCLFIGISFTDPNLRRLLDIAFKQRGETSARHVLIKKRVQVQSLKDGLAKIIDTNPELTGVNINNIAETLIDVAQNFEENDALSFGVRILWVDDYNEIPQILRDMRNP